MAYILNLPNNSHSDEERQRQFGPGFLVTGNFNIGRRLLRISEGEDRGNSPGYTNLLFPDSLRLCLYLFICLLVSPFLLKHFHPR